jgi:hypothetical protein
MALTAKAARQTGKLDLDYEFTLALTLPSGSTVDVRHTCKVPHDRMPWQGQTVPLRVSPSEPEKLTIEFDRVPSVVDRARASAKAAQAGDAAGAAEALGFTLRDPGPDGR